MVTGRRKLLLADDSLAIQKVVSLFFADEGMDVAAVSNGEQALEYLRENPPPDAVLADCFMPVVNGYELCERIKTDERWRHIPVLLLVSMFEPFNEAEARRVGADDVLTKPFQSIRDLMSKVGSMLGGGSKTARDDASPAEESLARSETETAQGGTASDPAPTWETLGGRVTAADSRDAGSGAYQPDPASSFADLGMDDQMIKATPADNFGDTTEEPAAAPSSSRQPAFAETASGHDEATKEAHADDPGDQWSVSSDEWSGAREGSPAYVASQQDVGEETLIAEPSVVAAEPAVAHAAVRPAYASHLASAAADDALLDLGEIELPAAAADDFVLDLDDETPATAAAPTAYQWNAGESGSASGGRESAAAPDASRADTAGAFAEAAHGKTARPAPRAFSPSVVEAKRGRGDEGPSLNVEDVRHAFEAHQKGRGAEEESAPQTFTEPAVTPTQEPMPIGMGSSRSNRGAEGDVARPPAESSGGTTGDAGAASRGGGGELSNVNQLSPEMIDAIARRAVEQLSERVVQEIAWEVVPQLAELLIKRRLDEEEARRQRQQ